MENDNFLVVVAVIAVLIAGVGFSVTYNSAVPVNTLLTGFATENGTINLTVSSLVSINITHANGAVGDVLDFGSGRVTEGTGSAALFSNGTEINTTTWTAPSEGFRIENIGNINVTLNISISETIDDFYGISGGNITFNITSYNASLRGLDTQEACTSWVDNMNNTYVELNITHVHVCSNFVAYAFDQDQDKLLLDIGLVIPELTPPGTKNTTLILTFNSA